MVSSIDNRAQRGIGFQNSPTAAQQMDITLIAEQVFGIDTKTSDGEAPVLELTGVYANTPRSTTIWYSSTCYGLIYGLNKTI